jgi:hypothetical protein
MLIKKCVQYCAVSVVFPLICPTPVCTVNNFGKTNIFYAFIILPVGLTDSKALRWSEGHFIGTEGKIMVMGLVVIRIIRS